MMNLGKDYGLSFRMARGTCIWQLLFIALYRVRLVVLDML